MRRAIAFGAGMATAVVLAALAGAAGSSDIYITGTAIERLPGSGDSLVKIVWDYKCLGEDRGTYEWTLKLVRLQPLPEKTTTLGSGTSERGEKTVRLAPGQYLPKADPYSCETDRGQGYDRPEIGGTFSVPDYCSWKVVATRGAVELAQGSAVKLARPGVTVAPGGSLSTPGGGKATIASQAGEGKALLGSGSQLTIDQRHCRAKGGWKLGLTKGSLTATVSGSAPTKGSYQTATPHATVSGARGTGWRVDVAGKATKVRALAGRVLVTKKAGAPKALEAGQSTTVK